LSTQTAPGKGAHQLEKLVALMALFPASIIFFEEAGLQPLGKVRIELRFRFDIIANGGARSVPQR